MVAVADLFALQETDLALDKSLSRLAEIDESIGETEQLQAARAAVEEKAATVRALKSQQKDLELVDDEARAKAAVVERKLYGGTVRNPKELEDLDADLKSLREQLRRRDDELLALLVQVDEAEVDLAAAEARFREIDVQWLADQQDLLAEKARIEPEIERLQSTRESQTVDLERTTLSLYQLLRDRRGGRAVARVEGGMCQGCRISLPMSVLQRARSSPAIVQCVSCERILLVS